MAIDVTGSDWHAEAMDEYTVEERGRIASAVEAERLGRHLSKEAASRLAKISSITWKRVEDGKTVQPTKLRAIEVAFEWAYGSMDRLARGREVVEKDPGTIEEIRERGWGHPHDRDLLDGFQSATKFAQDAEAAGAEPRLASDFIGDAVALLNSAMIGKTYRRKEGGDDGTQASTQKIGPDDDGDLGGVTPLRPRTPPGDDSTGAELSEADDRLAPAADDFIPEVDEGPGGSDDRG